MRPAALALLLLMAGRPALAGGPPFVTDDPAPVEYRHWEVYLAAIRLHDPSGSSGTLPHVEVNNGIAPNVQLHVILPYAYQQATGSGARAGYGDTEIGLKVRFLDEGRNRPMLGVFPLLEAPTGDAGQGLGNGRWQLFLPVWAQKSWGAWTTYGGGGYWIHPGAGNRDYWLLGWEAQKDLSRAWTLGGEIFYTTPAEEGDRSHLDLNVGGQYNFDEGHHLLFSVGRGLQGDTDFMSYLAYQWTFGPRSRSGQARRPAVGGDATRSRGRVSLRVLEHDAA